MAPSPDDGVGWRDVSFSRASIAVQELRLPRGLVATGPRCVVAHGRAAGVRWVLQLVEIRATSEAVAAIESTGQLLEFFAVIDGTFEGGTARLPLMEDDISGIGHRFGAASDEVFWVVAVPASVSSAAVRLDDGRQRSLPLVPVPSTSHAATVFLVPAASHAHVTLRTGGNTSSQWSRALPDVPRGSGVWHATALPPATPSVVDDAQRRMSEAMSDTEWLAWRRRIADPAMDTPLPRAIYAVPPPAWCARVRWGVGIGPHEALVGYVDHEWMDRHGRGGRDLNLLSTDHDAVVAFFGGSTTGWWLPDPRVRTPKELHGSLTSWFFDETVRHVASRPLLVGGAPRMAHEWHVASQQETVIVRIDMPEAWLTVEASGLDGEELEAQLRQVQQLQAGSATFRALRLRA